MDTLEAAREHLPMLDDDHASSLLSSAAALAAGVLTRAAVKAAWRHWRGEDPPADPSSSSTSWGEAIAWTAAISVAVGTARLLARRAAGAL